MTNERLSSLLHLGCARDLPATREAHVQHNAAPRYQASPTQARSDVSHETALAEMLRDASCNSVVLHCVLWICLPFSTHQIQLLAKTCQKGPSTGLSHRHCCISPSLQAICVSILNPAAHMHKTPTPHYSQGPVDQVSNNEQHHPVLKRRH